MAQISGPGEVVTFWLGQNDKIWFTADPAFDAEVLPLTPTGSWSCGRRRCGLGRSG
jgi:hypothetical protein